MLTPVTIGWLKPIILLPVGLINQLAPEEVEAVLAHELAHIARRDWLFNLIQTFIESIFYYHPAVWWLSGLIRQERENCCDDAAISATGNPIYLAKALVTVQQLATAQSGAMGFALRLEGTTNHPRKALLDRVRRILTHSQPTTSIMEKWIVTTLLLGFLIIAGLSANNTPITTAIRQISNIPTNLLAGLEIEPDTLPKPKSTHKQRITHDDGDQKVEMEVNNGTITKLSVDGKDIPAAEMGQYKALTEKLLNDIPPPPPPPPAGFDAPPFPDGSDVPPPPPPPAPRSPLVSKMRDDAGNIILKVEDANGHSVFIKVNDDKVTIDDRELHDGEAMEFFKAVSRHNDFQWDFNHSAPSNFPEGFDFKFEGFEHGFHFDTKALKELENLYHIDALEYNKGLQLYELNKSTEELRRSLEDRNREIRQMSKEAREAHRSAIKEAREAQESAIIDAREAIHEARAVAESRARLQEKIQEDADYWYVILESNDLIDDDDFSFNLTSKKLTINGVEQPDKTRDMMLALYEQRFGKKLKKGDNYMIVRSE